MNKTAFIRGLEDALKEAGLFSKFFHSSAKKQALRNAKKFMKNIPDMPIPFNEHKLNKSVKKDLKEIDNIIGKMFTPKTEIPSFQDVRQQKILDRINYHRKNR